MVVTVGVFWFFTGLLAAERLVEIVWARQNERRLLEAGYVESGGKHFVIIVALHLLFFASLIYEFYHRDEIALIPIFAYLFLIVQFLRFWVMRAIGKRFTTRILTKSGEKLIIRGPYKYFRHPIYLVVGLEILSLSLVVGDFWTALVFTILNAVLLWFIRIPAEEAALSTSQG